VCLTNEREYDFKKGSVEDDGELIEDVNSVSTDVINTN
jgi:hypothetical protein